MVKFKVLQHFCDYIFCIFAIHLGPRGIYSTKSIVKLNADPDGSRIGIIKNCLPKCNRTVWNVHIDEHVVCLCKSVRKHHRSPVLYMNCHYAGAFPVSYLMPSGRFWANLLLCKFPLTFRVSGCTYILLKSIDNYYFV